MLFIGIGCGRVQQNSIVNADYFGRHIFAEPVPYHAQVIDLGQLKSSVAARRSWGWKVAADILQPVALANPISGLALLKPDNKVYEIPTWMTWYEMHEFAAIVKILLGALDQNEMPNLASIAPKQVEKALATFHQTWGKTWMEASDGTLTKFERKLLSLTDQESVFGLASNRSGAVTLYSPALVFHVLRHVPQIVKCDRQPEDCLFPPFPDGTAAVKAMWRTNSSPIPVYDTDPDAFAEHLAQGTWVSAASVKATKGEILTAETYVSTTKKTSPRQLVGLHISAKNSGAWSWVSLWWHPRAELDFGSDRPQGPPWIANNGAKSIWSNYKMCITLDYDDHGLIDLDPLDSNLSSLVANLQLMQGEMAPASQCSNPYLESFAGGVQSNCLGCHQQAAFHASKHGLKNHLADLKSPLQADFLWSMDSLSNSFANLIQEAWSHRLEETDE